MFGLLNLVFDRILVVMISVVNYVCSNECLTCIVRLIKVLPYMFTALRLSFATLYMIDALID